jgi:MYXO-CTERM domain-containing protein
MVLGWAQQAGAQDPEFWTGLFDPTSGALTDKKKQAFDYLGGLSFDGTSYLEMWQGANYTGNFRRLDTSFALVDPSVGIALPLNADAHDSNRYGRSLVVGSEYRAEDLGTRLVGHFIDNELAPGDPDAAPVTCIPENAGGEGGVNGEGGVGGDNGGTGGTSTGGTGTAGTSSGGASDAGAANGGEVGAGGAETTGAGGEAAGGAGEPNQPGGAPAVGGAGTAGSAAGGTSGGVSAGNAGSVSGGATSGASAGGVATAGAAVGGTSSVASPPGSKDSGGCGCRVAHSNAASPWAIALGALALLRRRKRSAA